MAKYCDTVLIELCAEYANNAYSKNIEAVLLKMKTLIVNRLYHQKVMILLSVDKELLQLQIGITFQVWRTR